MSVFDIVKCTLSNGNFLILYQILVFLCCRWNDLL